MVLEVLSFDFNAHKGFSMHGRLRFFTHVLYLSLLVFTLAACGGGGSSTPVSNTSWAFVGITSASHQTTVSWTAVEKTTTKPTYNIYWSTTPGVTKQTGTKIAGVTSPYSHTGLANDTMYYYVITAVTDSKEGPESLEVATAPKAVLPLAPTGITVAPSNTSVQIKIDRTGAATTTKFNLYWSTTSDFKVATKIANAFGSSSSTFQHTGLSNGTTYYYAVTAEAPEGESRKSKVIAATPLADISAANYVVNVSQARIATPNAITALAASQQVTLTWNMPTNQIPTVFDPAATPTMPPVISSYTIYWSSAFINDITKANKIAVPVNSKTKLPITFVHNTGLANATPYYYLITAIADIDANGNPLKTAGGQPLIFESLTGSQISVVPEAKVPDSPTGFSAVSGAQKIALSWTKSTVANTTYSIYASTVTPTQPEDLVTSGNLIATTGTTAYTHSGLQNHNTYYYVVTAKTTGESAPTAVIAVSLW